jgi:chromosome segregation ATPase
MSEEAVDQVESSDEQENDITPPETNGWWQFQSKDSATNWVNEKIQKRLAREKSKYDPLVSKCATLEARVQELEPLEQATKTDTQRWEEERNSLATELEDLRKFRAQQERSNLVREIAEDKGLPARFLNRVQGDDADSITADIEELVTVLNDGKPTKPASRKPVDPEEKPGSKGYGGGGSKTDSDDKAVVDNVLKKFREQRHKSFVR